MKYPIFIAAVAATGVLFTGGVALARAGGPGHGVAFEALDANSDGQITREEMQAHGAARFAETDADGDGFLSKQELAEAARARADAQAERMMSRLDKDGDGKLAQAEMTGRRDPGRMFDRVDANDDGAISKAEFDAAREHTKGRMKGRHHRHDVEQ